VILDIPQVAPVVFQESENHSLAISFLVELALWTQFTHLLAS
jgi:hypothetical protein